MTEPYDGLLEQIPPRKGMRGRISTTHQHVLKGIENGTEVEVTGPGFDEQHVRVFTLSGGKEFDVPHWNVDVGQRLFLEGKWQSMDDPKVLAWRAANRVRRGIPPS